MKHWNFRKYCYLFLWLGLLLSVGAVWLFGGRALAEKKQGPAPLDAQNVLSPTEKSSPVPTAPSPSSQPEAGAKPELSGVWVSYLSLTAEEPTQEAFQTNYREIVDAAVEKGLNALFVHVRPFCDSLYPSKLFPWSHILTGEQGRDPGFDPLAFMVEYAHSQGMEFHAWINPLRVRTAETPESLSKDNPYLQLRDDYPYYFMEYGGGVYLDPAWPYIRTLIANGAAEIVQGYDVDGVHFDDYFYPSQDEGLDQQAYELYTQSVEAPLSLLEWRRANVSAMVQQVYRAVKKADPAVSFGISPQGNIENDENMGADVKAWCAVQGYVDYICPQLYYSFDNPALGYEEALSAWVSLPRFQGLELYAGLALYKAGSDADEGTWQLSDDTIRRQIESARAAQCGGVVLYSADYLDSPQTAQEMGNALEVLAPVE